MADRSNAAGLRQALGDALAGLEERELELVAVAIVHGVPVRQLVTGSAVSADDTHDLMIGALKKMRQTLDAAGYTSPALQTAFKK